MTIIDAVELAGVIDHTLLRPEATGAQIRRLCDEAIKYGFHTVFTNPRWTPAVADLLHGSNTVVGGVVSFPFGADFTRVKVAQAKELVSAGADEIDMVADIAAIIEGNESYLSRQLEVVLKVCDSMRPKVLLKVIIETAALTTEQKIFICRIADRAGVDFVKTSTGLHHAGGATVEDVKLMKEYAPHCRVKASGGIRTVKDALAMLEAGADRIGTSTGVQIIEQYRDIHRCPDYRTVHSRADKMTIATLPIERKARLCRLHYSILNLDIDLSSLSEVVSKLPHPAVLGGNTSIDGFSYWMAKPIEIFEFQTSQDEPLEKLQSALNRYKLTENPPENLPKGIFTGGWVGFFSYDLGKVIEPAACSGKRVDEDLRLPLVHLCFYDRLIAYDHRSNKFWLIALELAGDIETPQEKINTTANLLDKARLLRPPDFPPADIERVDFTHIASNMTRDYYLDAFAQIKRCIYDGDVYQINFSQRFRCPYNARPTDLFHWQNRYNPSPYSAYIDAGNFQIVSASPEMFITLKDRVISTKPIKGTRKRIETVSKDTNLINAENFQQLLDSEKEKAELNMIIDLERNDVARVCVPGTRTVTQERSIEAHPTVYHAVATVSGRLKNDVRFCDVLRAMFPGGSITGAPKIRSMQIIDEIEPTARGVYTGSVGFIGIDGNVCLNIAIRTIIIGNNTAYVQAGGGIVADSDPQAEYEETIIKARVLLAGIAAVNS